MKKDAVSKKKSVSFDDFGTTAAKTSSNAGILKQESTVSPKTPVKVSFFYRKKDKFYGIRNKLIYCIKIIADRPLKNIF